MKYMKDVYLKAKTILIKPYTICSLDNIHNLQLGLEVERPELSTSFIFSLFYTTKEIYCDFFRLFIQSQSLAALFMKFPNHEIVISQICNKYQNFNTRHACLKYMYSYRENFKCSPVSAALVSLRVTIYIEHKSNSYSYSLITRKPLKLIFFMLNSTEHEIYHAHKC